LSESKSFILLVPIDVVNIKPLRF